MNKIKLKLLVAHLLDGIKQEKDTIIEVAEEHAAALIEAKIGIAFTPPIPKAPANPPSTPK